MSGQILIINSDTEELRRLRELLSREGFSIMTAADRETAREIIRKIPVTLVLCEAALTEFC
ncbi:MAG: hypothetical protein KDI38_19280 [Calditrichaeota bacterium]|nr:hypothetical protein [Calditrichota bacterium]